MIHRLLAVAFVIALFAGSVFAMDIDRHGSYTEKSASGAVAAKCKDFKGTDDNRGHCTDWCSEYLASNAGNSCNCDEGSCADPAPAAAVLPPNSGQ